MKFCFQHFGAFSEIKTDSKASVENTLSTRMTSNRNSIKITEQ